MNGEYFGYWLMSRFAFNHFKRFPEELAGIGGPRRCPIKVANWDRARVR